MSSIIINISNCKQPGLTEIKRTVTVDQHYKNYQQAVFTVPYIVQHIDPNDQPSALIPDITGVLIADNIKRVWVRANGTFSEEPEVNTVEMGLYDFFENLQKTYSDSQILTGEISRLDGIGFFDPVVEGPDPVVP